MSKYFISVVERERWQFQSGELVEALKRQWPATRIVSDSSDDCQLVSFEVDFGGVKADAYLQAGGDCVVIDADLNDVAVFALWLRSLIPEHVPVLLWDEGYHSHIRVDRSSTVSELAAAFISTAPP